MSVGESVYFVASNRTYGAILHTLVKCARYLSNVRTRYAIRTFQFLSINNLETFNVTSSLCYLYYYYYYHFYYYKISRRQATEVLKGRFSYDRPEY